MTTGTGERPVAAVDCGTNSTRLLVRDGSGMVLDREMRITRLGEGVDATGKLAPEAIARTVSVLEDYRRVMDSWQVERARVVATSATRDASNAKEFFDAAESVIGFRPELLSGLEEGRLSFEGATADLPEKCKSEGPLLVVDIGGGSTELITGPAPFKSEDGSHPAAPSRSEVNVVSLEAGCVRITERFLAHDPPREYELAEARRFIGTALEHARDELPRLDPGGLVIGLAGTVSTLAAIEKGADVYDRSVVHHSMLSRDQISRWLETLSVQSASDRLAHFAIVTGREDVIVGGILVLDEVMQIFDRSICLTSEDDILDGLVASIS